MKKAVERPKVWDGDSDDSQLAPELFTRTYYSTTYYYLSRKERKPTRSKKADEEIEVEVEVEVDGERLQAYIASYSWVRSSGNTWRAKNLRSRILRPRLPITGSDGAHRRVLGAKEEGGTTPISPNPRLPSFRKFWGYNLSDIFKEGLQSFRKKMAELFKAPNSPNFLVSV